MSKNGYWVPAQPQQRPKEAKVYGVDVGLALPAEEVRARVERARSGAAGAHARSSVGKDAGVAVTRKMGSRRARTGAAIRDY